MTVGNMLVISLLIPLLTTTHLNSHASSFDESSSSKKHEKFVPLVAFQCGYRNKYMNDDGMWITDDNRYATCLSGKLDILKYCKKEFNGKAMTVRSFAVLEPCSLDLFTGVEFVCCPAVDKVTSVVVNRQDAGHSKLPPKEDETEEDYNEYDDSDEDLSTEKSSEDQDPYFKNRDSSNEHENFKDAEDRLDKKHREKIDKVMKEWGELEARYQQMKAKDAKGAESFKVSMTNRFQKTVASLEEEHKRLKKQLETTHEERVQAILNEKKRTATHDYRQALAMHDKSANKHHVLKTLKTYIRSEEKDRIHTINRYRHLLRVDQAEAAAFKPTVLHRLRYIDLRINGTLAMLRDFPDLESQVRPIAVAYWSDFRRENTPELSDSAIDALNSLDSDAKNKRLVDLYKEAYEKLHPSDKLDVKAPQGTTPVTTTVDKAFHEQTKLLSEDSHNSEEDDDEYYEDEDDEEVKKSPIVIKPKVVEIRKKEDMKKLTPPKLVEKSVQTERLPQEDDFDSNESDEDITKELRVDIEPIIDEKPAFYRHEKLVQNQKSTYYESGLLSSSQAVFMVGAVAIVSITILVATIIRRRRMHQGFIEVDVYTPEERHVAGMQVNGYENPTYSFFDSKA
ncbi:amyloid A4 extracellular domain protein [Dictyocaulus viviparus]|uniref:Amyloid A4 extracellular domain protein n=1 Tax=Dictyocaulus viviparus TaxID=29172 RepID=A0A0D8XIL1_DICVI|nr:amyloid A4 extracellular domain protein [Dictyocaulus viviparus]